MKKYFLFAIALFGFSFANAQDGVTKQVVNVERFTASSEFNPDEVNIIRNNVIQSLQNTKRIHIVDLQAQEVIASEAERRKSEAAINDMHDVADITQLNANFILRGNLNSLTQKTEQRKDLYGNYHTYYVTTINYTISLLNPATGATESSHQYQSSASSEDGYKVSRANAVNGTSSNMKKFIEECFPVKGQVIQVAEGNDKKAKAVYINLGRDQGIEKGQKFIVYAMIDVAGEMSEKEIGTLTVQEAMSATRSLCKVNDGGEEIKTLLTEGKEVTIKSRARTGWFGD